MKEYLRVLIKDGMIEDINDALVKDPSDELYPLTQKYNVKINRSRGGKSGNEYDTVYVFRKRYGFRVRIGHPIAKNQRHIRNFAENYEITRPNR